jgi:Fungal specific transcription factor domain
MLGKRFDMLCFHQAVPGMFSASSQQLAKGTIRHLALCPPSSSFGGHQIYPLTVAGCEADSQEEWQWVTGSWAARMARMRLPNVSNGWKITQEVWKRRNAYWQQKTEDYLLQQYLGESKT